MFYGVLEMKPRGLMTQLGASIGAVLAFQDKQPTAVRPICSKALLKAEKAPTMLRGLQREG